MNIFTYERFLKNKNRINKNECLIEFKKNIKSKLSSLPNIVAKMNQISNKEIEINHEGFLCKIDIE